MAGATKTPLTWARLAASMRMNVHSHTLLPTTRGYPFLAAPQADRPIDHPAKPKPRPRRRVRARILDARERCFVRCGFHRTTMQDVAAEAGMSPGNIYRYFRSKDAIAVGLAERDRARVNADFAALVDAEDFIGSFAALGRKHFEDEPRERAVLCLEIWAEATRNPTFAAITEEFDRDVIGRMASLFRLGPGTRGHRPRTSIRSARRRHRDLADGLSSAARSPRSTRTRGRLRDGRHRSRPRRADRSSPRGRSPSRVRIVMRFRHGRGGRRFRPGCFRPRSPSAAGGALAGARRHGRPRGRARTRRARHRHRHAGPARGGPGRAGDRGLRITEVLVEEGAVVKRAGARPPVPRYPRGHLAQNTAALARAEAAIAQARARSSRRKPRRPRPLKALSAPAR